MPDACRATLDRLLQAAVERGDIPGVVAEVANREQVLYCGAFGKLDSAGVVDMPTDALFRIMSMTKPVTSVGIMMLREQGLLDLDDPVAEYLLELRCPEVIVSVNAADASYATRPATGEITLRHLLTHTAGFGYWFCNDALWALRDRLPSPPPLLHDPGSRWTYGISTLFLGQVIERVTGLPLDVFFDRHIFGPLGMIDTGYFLKPEDRHRLASLFQRASGELVAVQRTEPYQPAVLGDQGLLSTADDYVRFLQMLLNMGMLGSTRLLTEDSVRVMTTNQIGNLALEEMPCHLPDICRPFPLGAGEDKFGLGFQLKEGVEKGSRSRGSYRWAGMFNTRFWGDPEHGLAVVLMMQVLPFNDERCIELLNAVERAVYAGLE